MLANKVNTLTIKYSSMFAPGPGTVREAVRDVQRALVWTEVQFEVRKRNSENFNLIQISFLLRSIMSKIYKSISFGHFYSNRIVIFDYYESKRG